MNAHARPAIQGDANVEDYDVKQDRDLYQIHRFELPILYEMILG